MKKINILKLFELLSLIISVGYILYNFYLLSIYSWINSVTVTLTLTGVGTLMLAIGIASFTYDDLFENKNR